MGTTESLSLTTVPSKLYTDAKHRESCTKWGIEVNKPIKPNNEFTTCTFPTGWSIVDHNNYVFYLAPDGAPVLRCWAKGDDYTMCAYASFLSEAQVATYVAERKARSDTRHAIDARCTSDGPFVVYTFESDRRAYDTASAPPNSQRRTDPTEFDRHRLIGRTADAKAAEEVCALFQNQYPAADVRVSSLAEVTANRWMCVHLTGYDSVTKETGEPLRVCGDHT